MFDTLKTPQDLNKLTTDFLASIPKTPEGMKRIIDKMQTVAETEYSKGQDIMTTYRKAAIGDASANEIASANKKAAELLKFGAFVGSLAIPGFMLFLPLIIKEAKDYDIDLVPASVASEFNI